MIQKEPIIGSIIALFVILLIVAHSPIVDTINRETRINASAHVSNLSCGPDTSVRQCPGDLLCASGPDGRFSTDRTGVNVSGARCVTPAFTEQYCGILEPPQAFDDTASGVLPCGPDRSLAALLPILIQTDLNLTDLPDRFLGPGTGPDLIMQHNLSLLIEDPDSSGLDRQVIDCRYADASLTETSYDSETGTVTTTITNTGTQPLPTLTLAASHDNTTTTATRDGPSENETRTYTLQAPLPSELHISLPACGNLPLATADLQVQE